MSVKRECFPVFIGLHVICDIKKSSNQSDFDVAQRGRPKTDTQPVMVRLPAEVLAEIDAARKNQDDLPTRPEMIRRMIEAWLRKTPDDQE
ncbi:ribbon-helix-helix protein, CopG family [Celeribacter sp.]|uniref:ribbon-helix-helix protein, CopG family n=1 Tax=Celeribacter sp. TaxID=1890673 RepID=UPI003A934713